MTNEDFLVGEDDHGQSVGDTYERDAHDQLLDLFEQERQRVFFSRQLEVRFEGQFFHWVTNRALRDLAASGVIRSEVRPLATGGSVTLMWHRSYRYYKREAEKVVSLVEEYASPNIGAALGLQGEALVLEGFARSQFLMTAREARSRQGVAWTDSNHDLDFIFERDGVAYGVEVKNTLGYMKHSELETKIDLAKHIGTRPVFAARMLPKSWITEINSNGGFALIMKYQFYPWANQELALRVKQDFGLPVDTPRRLADGTMARFLAWHDRNV